MLQFRDGGLLSVVESYFESESYNRSRMSTDEEEEEEVVEEDAPDDQRRRTEVRQERVFGMDISVEALVEQLEAVVNDKDKDEGREVPIRPEPIRPVPGSSLSSVPIVAIDGDADADTTGDAVSTTLLPNANNNDEEALIDQIPFHNLLKTKRHPSTDFLVDIASKTVNVSLRFGLRAAELGSVSFETKYKSLWNR